MTEPCIQLQGLSKRQHALAELLWNCDSQAAVEQLKRSLPGDTRKDAETVHQLLIAAVIDQYEAVTEDVKELLDRLK